MCSLEYDCGIQILMKGCTNCASMVEALRSRYKPVMPCLTRSAVRSSPEC
jgi:hypothetical protein